MFKLEVLPPVNEEIVKIELNEDDLGEFLTLLMSDGYHDYDKIFHSQDMQFILTNFFGIDEEVGIDEEDKLKNRILTSISEYLMSANDEKKEDHIYLNDLESRKRKN